MITDRTDLRPMAMCARDVRPGMVLVTATIHGDNYRTVAEVTDPADRSWRVARCGDGAKLALSGETRVLGETVEAREIAVGDTILWAGPTFVADESQRRGIRYVGGEWTRAYVDPEWERAQAERCQGCEDAPTVYSDHATHRTD
jgi:hypothetical protein